MTPPRFLAAISTPFAEDGSVALDAFAEHVAWLAAAVVGAVVAAACVVLVGIQSAERRLAERWRQGTR